MMQSAMMAYINVQCILDCLPVSVSTEPVYSDDQFAHSYSNPYKLNINVLSIMVAMFQMMIKFQNGSLEVSQRNMTAGCAQNIELIQVQTAS